MDEGDLGFGFGLKPGAISSKDGDLPSGMVPFASCRKRSPRKTSAHDMLSTSSRKNTDALMLEGKNAQSGTDARRKGGCQRRLKRSNSVGSMPQMVEQARPRWEDFPSFAGVAMGTSLRQQRELFQKNMEDFLRKKDELNRAAEDDKDSADGGAVFAVQKSIVQKLQATSEEVMVLQSELEACRSQLDSKYRAIRILQSQVSVMNAEKQKNIDAVRNEARSLQREVNALQFELDAKSSSYMFSEQMWAERFDRLSIENTALMATLQARSDEVRRLHTDKMGLIRERDELLAMMDANERLQYDRHWSPKNEAYLRNNSVSEQLAVLGSCTCRGNKPEPCRCAKTAALLKKENSAVKDENFELKEKLEEAYLVADAFRKAFEDQLNRNSAMSKQLADSSDSGAQRDADKNGKRRKALMSWLKKKDWRNGLGQPGSISQLLEETMGIQALVVNELDEDLQDNCRSIGVQVSQPMPDLIKNMAELLNDKSEALAHQRLVTKMLARRTQDLEATVQKYDL